MSGRVLNTLSAKKKVGPKWRIFAQVTEILADKN